MLNSTSSKVVNLNLRQRLFLALVNLLGFILNEVPKFLALVKLLAPTFKKGSSI